MQTRTFEYKLALVLVAIFTAPASSFAQTVRSRSFGFGSVITRGDRAAEKAVRKDWPRIRKDESGTQVHVSFNARNADVTLYSDKSISLRALLERCRFIAQEIGDSRADYVTSPGKHGNVVDIELNKYLVKTTDRIQFWLDLGKLKQALQAAKLPNPVVSMIVCDDADQVSVVGPDQTIRPLSGNVFYSLDELPNAGRLHFDVTLPWYAYAVAYGIVALIALPLLSVILLPFRVARSPIPIVAPATDPDPSAIQKQYDRAIPIWAFQMFAPLVILLPFAFLVGSGVMHKAVILLPLPSDTRFIFLAPLLLGGLMFTSILLSTKARRRRLQAPDVSDEARREHWRAERTATGFLLPMIPMFAGMMLMPLITLIPAMQQIERPWRLLWINGILLSSLSVSAGIAIRRYRKLRTALPSDDRWRQMAEALASKAEITVRRVEIADIEAVNAYATPFGTVGLTKPLLVKMDPTEIRAILAHEIGHLKEGHARTGLVINLGLLAIIITLWTFTSQWVDANTTSKSLQFMMRGPFFGIFILPIVLRTIIGPRSRRNEIQADRFAVEATGDPELFINALIKLHDLNASPHRLKRGDEIISTHPSLIHRINAIRMSDFHGV